jgi:hypothetical protein
MFQEFITDHRCAVSNKIFQTAHIQPTGLSQITAKDMINFAHQTPLTTTTTTTHVTLQLQISMFSLRHLTLSITQLHPSESPRSSSSFFLKKSVLNNNIPY